MMLKRYYSKISVFPSPRICTSERQLPSANQWGAVLTHSIDSIIAGKRVPAISLRANSSSGVFPAWENEFRRILRRTTTSHSPQILIATCTWCSKFTITVFVPKATLAARSVLFPVSVSQPRSTDVGVFLKKCSHRLQKQLSIFHDQAFSANRALMKPNAFILHPLIRFIKSADFI